MNLQNRSCKLIPKAALLRYATASPGHNNINELVVAFCALLIVCGSVAAQDHSYTVSGLEQTAEIVVDEWGVPHIYANTHYDAFFVQGFNAARDRLWQIDVWRRRGLGQLSEVFGAEYLDQDRATRLFLCARRRGDHD